MVNTIIHLMANEFLQSINVDHRIIHEATIRVYLTASGNLKIELRDNEDK